MAARHAHRQGREGETGNNGVTFSHISLVEPKIRQEKRTYGQNEETSLEREQSAVFNSWKHVAVWKGRMAADPHDVRLGVRRKIADMFIWKKDLS